jgi:SPP1 gp7 family putative phage head morphogenesis protein
MKYTIYYNIIRQNAELISSLPSDIAKRVSVLASQEAIRGKRAESIINTIWGQAPSITRSRAKLIARTETAKAQAAITQVRAESIGLDWYIWQTSSDQRVRNSHEHMQGVACQYSNQPSPEALAGEEKTYGYYGPGNIWNCRCYAAPITDIEFESFPLKVVQNGKIKSLSKKQFSTILGG